jgi:hypothetical protein
MVPTLPLVDAENLHDLLGTKIGGLLKEIADIWSLLLSPQGFKLLDGASLG